MAEIYLSEVVAEEKEGKNRGEMRSREQGKREAMLHNKRDNLGHGFAAVREIGEGFLPIHEIRSGSFF